MGRLFIKVGWSEEEMNFDGIKGFKIVIEKDGYNESVAGTKRYRLYIEEKLLTSSAYYLDIKKRLIKILDAAFGDLE